MTSDSLTASATQLDASIDHITKSPSMVGAIELIVRRPETGAREIVDEARLEPGRGLVGDNYVERGSTKTPDGLAHPLAELTLMNVRALAAVAGDDHARWSLAGDQLLVDFDLSERNCPAGTRLVIGTAIVEVTAKPHTGCAKFAERFGIDAARWINSRQDLRLRGINAVVVSAGVVTKSGEVRLA